MANLKISELTSNPSIDGSEEIPSAKSGSNFKMTLTAIATWLGLSAFLKTDGTTNGATSQAQQFDNGVTANSLGPTVNRGMDVNGIYISDTHNTASMASDGTVTAESNDNSTKTELNPDGSITYVGKSGSTIGDCIIGFKKIHLTSADIQTGNSVPIVLIPAQGVGTVVAAMVDTKARCINGVVPFTAGEMDIKNDTANNVQIAYRSLLSSATGTPIEYAFLFGIDENIIQNKDLVAVFTADNPLCDAEIDIYLIYQILTL